MPRFDDDQINERLDALHGWERRGQAIQKTYRFDGFPAAIRFVDDLAERAEAADHHPDIDIRYDTVVLALSTHSEGGLTQKDFDLARDIDGLQSAGS